MFNRINDFNPSVMLSPLTNNEEAGLLKEGEKFKDIQEIVNYREALRSAHYYLEERPLSLSFVKELPKCGEKPPGFIHGVFQ
jgi:hypothetical protein